MRRGLRKDPEMGVRETKGRSRGDPGKILRSEGFGVQGCRRKFEEDRWWRGEQGVGVWARGGGMDEDETRAIGGVEESLGVKGGVTKVTEERGEKKT